MLKNIAHGLIYLPYVWLFTGLFWLKNGHKIMAILVLVACLAASIYKKSNLSLAAIKERLYHPFTVLLLVYTAFAIFSYVTYGYSSREMRALIASSVLLLLAPINVKTIKPWLPIYLLFASIGASIYLYIQIHVLHLGRGNWSINAIPYATYCASLALLGLFCLKWEQQAKGKLMLGASLLLAISAAFYTQTRGIWLALTIAIIILAAYLWRKQAFERRTLVAIAVVMALATSLLWPQLNSRYQHTVNEYHAISNGNLNTSIGLRLQMWSAAIKLFPQAPLLGHGDNHSERLQAMNDNQEVSNNLIQFNPAHYHNQYLDKLVKGGVIGLVLFLALLALPLWLARGQVHQPLAVSMCALYAMASLTDVPFNHPQIAYLFFILMGVLMNSGHTQSMTTSNQLRESHA